ncbi:MAG: hypothetical protein WDZ35_12780 [Crocinitomicaceae bacterium]
MNRLKERLLQKKNLWHVGAIALFILISSVYFYPAYQGYTVDQGDVTNYVGASQEIKDYRETDDQVGWTNSMFSGMPATQISMSYKGRGIPMFLKQVMTLWLPKTVSILFLYFLGFYILALSLRIKPVVAIVMALAFGFSSSQIIIIEAGHITKAFAIGFAPMVVAGMIMAYRWRNWLLGVALSALFMTFELLSNHLQITYYTAFILIGVGVVELIRHIKKEEGVSRFIKKSIGLIVAYGLAILVNSGNIIGTNEYVKYTTRGGTDLTISADGQQNEKQVTSGLDREYITAWSYGKGETFTFLVPNFKGGETMRIADNEANEEMLRKLEPQYKDFVKGQNQYWGDQPFTSGPVYLGIIVFFLAILGLVYSKERLRWALLIVTIVTVLLSWGKNFMGFTDFFLEYLPGYNKFRAVTIILAVAQLCVPLLGVLFLHRLVKARKEIYENIQPFFITAGALGFILLAFLAAPGLFQDFLSVQEKEMLDGVSDPQQYDQYAAAFDELKNARISIFRRDVLRSFALLVIGFIVVLLFIRDAFNKYVLAGVLAVLMLFDLGMVGRRYLGVEKSGKNFVQWVEAWKQTYPYSSGAAEEQILALELQKNPDLGYKIDSSLTVLDKELKDEDISATQKKRMKDWVKFRILNRNTNYRVLDVSNPFNSSYASYFHKSIGGYHGAKLGRYQELIEFHIGKQNPAVLDMLNMRYQIASQAGLGGQMNSQFLMENPSAMGNAWLTKKVKVVESADEAILALESSNAVSLNPFSNNFMVLVNGKEVQEKMNVKSTDKVALVAPQIRPDSSVFMDTMEIGLPFKEVQQLDFALIPGEKPGTLNWAYNDMLDSSYNDKKIIVVAKESREGWDPQKETIVHREFADQLSQKEYTANGTVSLKSYHPDKLVYSFSSPDKQLVVFSEIYYPIGWQANIDGEAADILRVNYTLRAIEVPAGDHEIVVKYELTSRKKSALYAYIGSFSIIFLLAAAIFFQTKIEETEGIEKSLEKESED